MTSHEFDVVKSHRNDRQVTLPSYRQKRMLPGANNVVVLNLTNMNGSISHRIRTVFPGHFLNRTLPHCIVMLK
jgi:hypothetical protein